MDNGWQKVFFKNIDTYIALINNKLSEEYVPKPLNKHVKILGGYAFKSSLYRKSGIPIIRISDFSEERIKLDNVKFYDEDVSLDRYQLFAGDIIIALTGGTIGKLAVVQKDLGIIYLNQRVGKFQILNNNEFENGYVYWLARGVQAKVKSIAWGGAQPNVSPRQIENINFPIPDKNTQIKIISFLEDLSRNNLKNQIYFNSSCESEIKELHQTSITIDCLSLEHDKQHSLLKQLRKSILQEAVEGKLTANWRKQNPEQISGDRHASRLLEKIKAEKARLTKGMKKIKELPAGKVGKPFDLPEGWVWCRLVDYGFTQTGTTPSTTDKSNFGNFIPFIKPADITTSSIDYFNDGLSETGLYNGRLIEKGSILMVCIGGSIGKSYFTDRPVTCNQQINTLTPASLISEKFLQNILQSNYFYFEVWDRAMKSSIPIINKGKWENIPLPLPPLFEQQAIVEKVDHLMDKIDALEEQVKERKEQAEQLMQAVLREAFEGN